MQLTTYTLKVWLGLRILCSKNSQLFYSCILTKHKYYTFSSNTYAQQNVYYSQFSCHTTCKRHNRKISKWKQASVSCHMRLLLAGCSILLQLPWSWYIGRISCAKVTRKHKGRSVWLLVRVDAESTLTASLVSILSDILPRHVVTWLDFRIRIILFL